jgi:hypothetical protein
MGNKELALHHTKQVGRSPSVGSDEIGGRIAKSRLIAIQNPQIVKRQRYMRQKDLRIFLRRLAVNL